MPSMRNLALRGLLLSILALSGAGAFISGELVKRQANPSAIRSGIVYSLCQASAQVGFSCDAALTNRWSQINLPVPIVSRDLTFSVRLLVVPVAFLGLAYFVFIAIWFLFIPRPGPSSYHWLWVVRYGVICGGCVSLFYVGVMAVGAASWCLLCLVVHVINFLMIAAVLRICTWHRLETMPPARHRLDTRGTGATHPSSVIAFSLIIIAGLWMYRREHIAFNRERNSLLSYKATVASLKNDPNFVLRKYFAQPKVDIPLRSGESSTVGDAQLVVFTDFQCPTCACKIPALVRQVVDAFKGKVSLITRHYPLCSQCNDAVKGKFHENACQAAYAAEAAGVIGGPVARRRMEKLLYINGHKLDQQKYRELAIQVGIDPDRLLSEMAGDAVRQIVRSDVALAHRLGVKGTPTLFLNGRRITSLIEGPALWRAVAAATSPEDEECVTEMQPLAGSESDMLANRSDTRSTDDTATQPTSKSQ